MTQQCQPLALDAEKARQDRPFLEMMAADQAGDDRTRKRAKLLLGMLDGVIHR